LHVPYSGIQKVVIQVLLLTESERESQTWRMNLWFSGESTGEGIVRESGTNMDTLICLKWTTSKDLLYSTENSAHCYVAAWVGMGGELGKNRHMYENESERKLDVQSCPTLWDPMDCKLPAPLFVEIFRQGSTRVGCHSLLQGIFPTRGSNLGLLHCRQILYQLSHQGR